MKSSSNLTKIYILKSRIEELNSEKRILECTLGASIIGGAYLLYKSSGLFFLSLFFGSFSIYWIKRVRSEINTLREELSQL
jgi:hypothetical protein